MSTWIRLLIGAGAGMLCGAAAGYFGKCSSGTCPLTANPLRGALLGTLIGAMLALSMSPASRSKEDSNGSEKSAGHAHGQIVQVTGIQEFETRVLQADKPVLVDFSTIWCPPCKLLAPIIDRLANKYTGRVEFVKVDGDRSGQLMSEYGVSAYPTVMIFAGGRPAKRLVGLQQPDEYRGALEAALAGPGGEQRE